MNIQHLERTQTNFRSIFDTLDVAWPNQHYYRMDVPNASQIFSNSIDEGITIIDLRSHNEVDKQPYKVSETNVDYLHLPIYGETERMGNTPELLMKFNSMGEMYVYMTEHFSDNIANVIRHILLNKNDQIIFHCSAGKDRTGIVAMLLLEILDAPRDVIIESYILSETNRQEIHEQIKEEAKINGQIIPDYIFQTRSSDIQQLYNYLEDNYGSIKNYLRAHGIQDEWMDDFNSYVKGDFDGTNSY